MVSRQDNSSDAKRKEAIERAKILKTLIEIQRISIILNTFIKSFKNNSVLKGNDVWYLHGNFNLGGTKSMRLSSNGPNLHNLPSGSTFGKLIKKCFIAPPGWLMAGADFNALEATVDALITKDPAKLVVYTDNYDSHCWNSYSYFHDQMPDIQKTPKSINSIKQKYPDLRQKSKTVTFALQYGGTEHTLINNCNFPRKSAIEIVERYHELYTVSDKWTAIKLNFAAKHGYVPLAFGGRLRTPILKQTILNTRKTPYEAKAEARTAGNALIQSYGLLNNRAAIEFQARVIASKYAEDILPIALIHDAIYCLVRNTVGCIEWFNQNLIECMSWNDLPELKHDVVGIGAEIEIYYPSWAVPIAIPNNATMAEILEICKK